MERDDWTERPPREEVQADATKCYPFMDLFAAACGGGFHPNSKKNGGVCEKGVKCVRLPTAVLISLFKKARRKRKKEDHGWGLCPQSRLA